MTPEMLIAQIALPLIFLVMIEGETFVILGGVLAQQPHFSLWAPVLAAGLDCLSGSSHLLGWLYTRRGKNAKRPA